MQEYFKITIIFLYSQINKSINVCINHTLDEVFPVIIVCNGYYSIVCPGIKVVRPDPGWLEETA